VQEVIYEITGISDILRGSSVASETATAQNIKTQWGTLRLKRLQKEVQRYARDLLRMTLEIAASKFSEDTWAKMTGLPYHGRSASTTRADGRRSQAAGPASHGCERRSDAAGSAADSTAGRSGQTQLSVPVWEQVLATLKDDTQRAYRIDIETNSTVEPEAVEDQKTSPI
jgi:hypothetical protein